MISAAMSTSTESRLAHTHRDHSGALTALLTGLLETGELLRERAKLIDCQGDPKSFVDRRRRWVLDCLPVLSDGFEPETVCEFIHVTTQTPRSGEADSEGRSATAMMSDALELLRGLRATLDYDSPD